MLPTALQTPLNELSAATTNYRSAIISGDQSAIDTAKTEYEVKYGNYIAAVRQLKSDNPDWTDVDFFSDTVAAKSEAIQYARGQLGHTFGLSTRFVVMEVIDHHAGNGGAINELEFYKEDTLIPFTPVSSPSAYFRTQGDVPYWNSTMWDKTHLNDRVAGYSSGASTFFNYGSNPGDVDAVSRVIIDLGQPNNGIDDIRIWTGDANGAGNRAVKTVNFYELDSLEGIDQTALLDPNNQFKRLIATINVDTIAPSGQVTTANAEMLA